MSRTIPRVSIALGLLSTLLLLSMGSVHCGGSAVTSIGDGGGGGNPDGGGPPPGPPPPNLPPPTNHRPNPDVCPSTRPAGLNSDAGVPDSGFAGDCARDSDCTQGTNGRCLPSLGNRAGDFCSYDECSTDTDCGGGKACECGSSLGTNGSDGTPMRTGNRCLPGNCRVDADCGAGGYCSPTYDTSCGPRNGVVGFYCHTPKDECTNDNQCGEGGIGGYCAWAATSGRWVCEYGFCAG